jgi:exosortase
MQERQSTGAEKEGALISRSAGLVVRVLLALCVSALLYVIFHLLGNTVENAGGRSVFRWMVARWNDPVSYGTDYSIGWIIPVVSAWVIWRRRSDLASAPRSVYWPALLLVLAALVLHWLGARAQQTRVSLVSFVVLLWAIPLLIYGRKVAKISIFPCAYLLFCIPYNFLDAATFPLRLFASKVAAGTLNGLGLPVERTGTIIRSLGEAGFDFNVADPCSGLHSLLAMGAITAVFSFLTQPTLLRKWTLFISALPIAIASNVTRIVLVSLIAAALGADLAVKVYEQFSGYLVFIVGIALMLGLSHLMDRRWKGSVEHVA